MTEGEKKWLTKIIPFLVGKTIKSVRYMTPEETEDAGWNSRPLIIQFEDGSYIYPMKDDEGNDAGSYFTSDPILSIIPTL